MATHSSILAWEICQRSLVGYSPWGLKRAEHDLAITIKKYLIGKGNEITMMGLK